MKIVFTCGGTAGHVNPALALAQMFAQRHEGCEILFIGAEKGMEQRLVSQAGFPIEQVTVSTFERAWTWKIIKHNIKSVFKVSVGRRQARNILKRFRPDLVVGTGGYASFPAVREAARLGIPTAIHESNAIPGLTTKTLADKVDLVMVGFPEAKEHYHGARRVEVTGTPVRGRFFELDREAARLELGITDNRPLVVSFWGSQGAVHMNRHTVDFIRCWAEEDRPFHYIHSAGRSYETMTAQLAEQGVEVGPDELRPYIDNMPTVMAAADLVICRAGASTLGEVTALGKPAILVPSPFVAANHQYKNAIVLADRGGALLLEEKDISGSVLYEEARQLLVDGGKRASMARSARELATPNAAEDIYQALLTLL